jgi:hypothetical protein
MAADRWEVSPPALCHELTVSLAPYVRLLLPSTLIGRLNPHTAK